MIFGSCIVEGLLITELLSSPTNEVNAISQKRKELQVGNRQVNIVFVPTKTDLSSAKEILLRSYVSSASKLEKTRKVS